jgi:hypothetical protein
MSNMDQEILVVENMIKDIEDYVEKAVWNPDRNLKVASEITKSDVLLDQLIMGHSMKIDTLSQMQISLVSRLLKRLHQAKEKLPSPPWAT